MSARATTPPKRRASETTAPPPKATKMSASAPVFNPSRPLPTASSSTAQPTQDGVSSAVLKDKTKVEQTADEDEGITSSLTADAIRASRVTKPLPGSRGFKTAVNMAPIQATTPKTTEEKENTRRLIVVLSQVSSGHKGMTDVKACLEAYKLSSGSAGRESKYTILNCDDVSRRRPR